MTLLPALWLLLTSCSEPCGAACLPECDVWLSVRLDQSNAATAGPGDAVSVEVRTTNESDEPITLIQQCPGEVPTLQGIPGVVDPFHSCLEEACDEPSVQVELAPGETLHAWGSLAVSGDDCAAPIAPGTYDVFATVVPAPEDARMHQCVQTVSLTVQ